MPVLPEALATFKLENRHVDGVDMKLDGEISDSFAALSTGVFNLASLLPPIFGGFMYENFGFRGTLDACMIIMLVVTALFVVFNTGCHPIKDAQEE